MSQEEKVSKWVEENYLWFQGEVMKNIAKGKMGEFGDDLVQEIILSLYKITPKKWDKIERESGIRAYVLTSAGMALRSKTSPFYLKIRKERMNAREPGLPGSERNIFDRGEIYEEYNECFYQCFQREFENLHWYLKRIMDEYWFQRMTLDQIREKYGISKRHLTKDLNEGIYTIRRNCKECDN